MKGKYDDIINLPHHVSKTHSPMKAIDRAAQFSPFAALTGHDSAVKETARLTYNRIELDEYMKISINNKLQIIEEDLENFPEIQITYFQPDLKKKGGSYVTSIGAVKKIDEFKRVIIMTNGTVILIDEIISIEVNEKNK
jgi:hypothetical protein